MSLVFSPIGTRLANRLLAEQHYLGIHKSGRYVFGGFVDDRLVAVQVWRQTPTSRHLPQDGTWLELSRWCLTPEAGKNAGSRMHGWVVRWLRRHAPRVTTLVSYSDPSQGHTGALYKACNWAWAPTWMRLRPPPSGHGSWDGETQQGVKDRWVFCVCRDTRREAILAVTDTAALRAYEATS
jgi:hypothetical protein